MKKKEFWVRLDLELPREYAAEVHIDKVELLSLIEKADNNCNGKAKSGPVHVVSKKAKRKYEVTVNRYLYNEDCERVENKESLTVMARTKQSAIKEARRIDEEATHTLGVHWHRSCTAREIQ